MQQCVNVLAGSKATLAILPAGTANLFATNLGIPEDDRGRRPDRAPRNPAQARRRDRERRALRRHGRRRLRRAHDRRRERTPQGHARSRDVRLDRSEEPPHQAVPRHDPRGRLPLVPGQDQLHPRRQRRQAVRRCRGLRRRARGRRAARARDRDRRRPRRVDADARADRRRHAEQVAVRAHHEGALGGGRAEPQGAVRARWGRPHEDEVAADRREARRCRRLRGRRRRSARGARARRTASPSPPPREGHPARRRPAHRRGGVELGRRAPPSPARAARAGRHTRRGGERLEPR